MSGLTASNYLECCRICLKIEGSASFLDLYTTQIKGDSVPLWEALSFLSVDIGQKQNGLPNKVCVVCFMRITDAYRLVSKISKNRQILEQLKRVVEKEEVSEDSYNTDIVTEDFVLPKSSTSNDESTVEIDNYGYEEEEVEQKCTILEKAENTVQSKTGEVVEEYVIMDVNDDCEDAVQFMLKSLTNKNKKPPVVKEKQRKAPSTEPKERPHQCEVCEKSFLRRSNLVDHLRLHANVKIFACDYCDKSFVQSGNLKAHLRTHTNDKPYSCDICHKSYTQSSALNVHMKSHKNLRNFVCDVCPKAFTNSSDLTKHKLIHSNVKNFKCPSCEWKFFTQKVHLKKHLQSYHPHEDIEAMLLEGTLKPSKTST